MSKKIVEYKADDITILWEPELCTHAGICVKTLPNVYNPKDRPWVKPEFATTDELIKQIDACPSGALKYVRNKK